MSCDRTESSGQEAVEVAASQGATARKSWRFNVISAALLGLAALLRLMQAEAAAEGSAAAGKITETKSKTSPVTLAEVTVSAKDAQASRLPNIKDLLRHDVEQELAAIDWCLARPGEWLMCRRFSTEKEARTRASMLRGSLKRRKLSDRVSVVADSCEMFLRGRPQEPAA